MTNDQNDKYDKAVNYNINKDKLVSYMINEKS